MKFKFSTLLIFLTGKWYPMYGGRSPTMLLGPLSEFLSGQSQTMFLPAVKKEYEQHVWNDLSPIVKHAIETWEHSDNWEEKLVVLDAEFGKIEITKPE